MFGPDWSWEHNLSSEGGLNTDAGMSERAGKVLCGSELHHALPQVVGMVEMRQDANFLPAKPVHQSLGLAVPRGENGELLFVIK